MPALSLTDVRAVAAAALAPQADTDPTVLADLVDAVTPPALMLGWDDPWIAMATIGGAHGYYAAQFVVLCFAGRLEPGAGQATLEELVGYTINRLAQDPQTAGWPLNAAQAPRRFDVSGIALLGARLSYQVPVSFN